MRRCPHEVSSRFFSRGGRPTSEPVSKARIVTSVVHFCPKSASHIGAPDVDVPTQKRVQDRFPPIRKTAPLDHVLEPPAEDPNEPPVEPNDADILAVCLVIGNVLARLDDAIPSCSKAEVRRLDPPAIGEHRGQVGLSQSDVQNLRLEAQIRVHEQRVFGEELSREP